MFTKPSLAVGLRHAARSGGLRYLACMPGTAFPTAKDGVLERVRQISQTLAQRFSWNPLQATLFLLTDEVPVVPAIKVTPEVSRIPACTRLIMDIDPMAAPQAVLESFRRARREVFARRLRSLSVKHLRLASFIAQRGVDEGWPALHQEWNKRHRKWAYLRLNIFKRDFQRARERVLALGVSYESPGPLRGREGREKATASVCERVPLPVSADATRKWKRGDRLARISSPRPVSS